MTKLSSIEIAGPEDRLSDSDAGTPATDGELPRRFDEASGLPQQIRIISHNIRYAATELFPGEKLWSDRKPLIVNQLRHETKLVAGPSLSIEGRAGWCQLPRPGAFICLQEVLHSQLIDILSGLNKTSSHSMVESPDQLTWAYVGVGRDDGHHKGEYSPILYPVQVYRVLHKQTVWLSPTPTIPSKGWDAGSIRILTVAVFEHRQTSRVVVASNTHLDNVGSVSRLRSVPIILDTLRHVARFFSAPVFLAGDFNSQPDQEAYQALKNSGYMTDLMDSIPSIDRYGEEDTFTGFDPDKEKDEQGRIDFIWLGPSFGQDNEAVEILHPIERTHQSTQVLEQRHQSKSLDSSENAVWIVDGYSVLPNVFQDGVFASDHRAVVGDVRLR